MKQLMNGLKTKHNPHFVDQMRDESKQIKLVAKKHFAKYSVAIPSANAQAPLILPTPYNTRETKSGEGEIARSVFDVLPSNGGFKAQKSMFEDISDGSEPEVEAGSVDALTYAQILQQQISDMRKPDWKTRKLYHKLSQNHLNN